MEKGRERGRPRFTLSTLYRSLSGRRLFLSRERAAPY